MEQRLIIHILGGDSRSRAEQARTAFALGHHAEVYSDLSELLERPPQEGVVLLREGTSGVAVGEFSERVGQIGLWLPVIVCDDVPKLECVVEAIRSGALDYLQLPLETGRLARSLDRVASEGEAQLLARRRVSDARRRIGRLSKREREVLELLGLGTSNKLIARELAISPRTVEIHRSNMMSKLRAGHAAEAVRLWLEFGLETSFREPPREEEVVDLRGLPIYPDFARRVSERVPDVKEEDGAEGLGKTRKPRRAGSR